MELAVTLLPLLLTIGTLATVTHAVKLPSCDLKRGLSETPCARFKPINQDCCPLDYIVSNNDSVSTQHLAVRPRRGSNAYISASISIPSTSNISNEFVLMLHHRLPSAPLLCWNVQLQDDADVTSYESAVIKFILRSDFADGWTANTYNTDECDFTIEDPEPLESREAAADETRQSCDLFRQSKTTFKATSARKELEFSMLWNASLPLQLVVLHHSAPHNITCNGSANQGFVDRPAPQNWYNVSEPWRTPVNAGFHCLTISLRNDHVCLIYTETTFIQDLGDRPPVHGTAASRIPTILLAAALSCACVATLLVAAYRRRIDTTPRADQGSSGSSPLLINRKRILLLYSRDSEQFCQLVSAFTQLLQLLDDGIEIIDPFDESLSEEISLNSEMWLCKLLYTPTVKVILITSEGAILRQRALQSGLQVVSSDPHCLDTVFTSALNHLINPQLAISHDYQRMFVVRFDELPSIATPIGITPFRCFMLLHHWDAFTRDILQGNDWSGSSHTPGEVSIHNRAVEEFKTSLEQVKQHQLNNPGFINQKWILINHL